MSLKFIQFQVWSLFLENFRHNNMGDKLLLYVANFNSWNYKVAMERFPQVENVTGYDRNLSPIILMANQMVISVTCVLSKIIT